MPLLFRVFSAFFRGKSPSTSFCLGTVKLLFKNKGDRDDLDSYRPIMLLNIDYKILTSVLTSSLKEVLPSILVSSQAYWVKGRTISDTILPPMYTVEHMEKVFFFFFS